MGITLLTFTMWNLNQTYPSSVFSFPTLTNCASDYVDVVAPFQDLALLKKILPATLAFIFIGIFDVSGVMFGLSALGDLMEDDGTIPGSLWAFLGSSVGSCVAACMGCTPIIITVECAAGIKEGGRTGLTAVTIGILFLLSLFFAPLFGSVPQEATAPVLILVGAMMMGESKNIDWENMASAIPAFLTIIMMPLTYSITNGIMFGLVSAACFYFTTGGFFADVKNYLNPTEEVFKGTGIGSDEEEQSLLYSPGGTQTSKTQRSRSNSGLSDAMASNELLARHPSFFNQSDNAKVASYENAVLEGKAPKTSPRLGGLVGGASPKLPGFGAVVN